MKLKHLTALWMLLIIPSQAYAQDVWFAPNPPTRGQRSDFMDLFTPDAPWQQVAAHVRVFSLGGWFAATASDDSLRRIFADLKRRSIALQIGYLPLNAPDGGGPQSCAYRVEGYGGSPMLRFAQRMKYLGAEPQFIGMDEPLYFGHVFREGRRGCQTGIADLAKDVAAKFHEARQVFPNVHFGDVEPLTFRPNDPWFTDGRWLRDLSEWFDAYEAATGDKLAYFKLDLWWDMPWQHHMPELADLLKRKGIPLQVIYNASDRTRSDAAWSASTEAHFKAFESGPWPKPTAVVFQYWTPHPSRILPESEPTTATGIIAQYLVVREQSGRP